MSDDIIRIRVPMVVTADGKWAVMGSHATVNYPDWSYVDEMCDYENPTVAPRRYWITAYVKKPEIGEIAGAAIPEVT